MAAADIRDMLDLPQESQPRPVKKQKVAEPKRPEGYNRELYALLGDKAPPIALTGNKYKGRKKWTSKLKVRPWEVAPFTNGARSDGLVLHHWQRKAPPTNIPLSTSDVAPEEDDTGKEAAQPAAKADEYAFAKYNVKPKTPRRYTDDEYDKSLQSDLWSREETDYLMDLVEEFDLRWILIADRYNYQPSSSSSEADSMALVAPSKPRTMEEIKSRYYTVAGKMLATERPLSDMSQAEFSLYETMMKFNPERERQRKELATVQFDRTKDEVQEEGLLLEELKRIVSHEQSFIEERKELYARLEAPASTGNTAMYQSSHGLSQLLASLVQADKNKKRRSLLGPEQGAPSPVGQTAGGAQSSSQSARESRQETPATTTQSAAANKKGGAAAAAAQQPAIRTLSPSEEVKYGVSHHERLTSGVQFRNDKAQKLTQAKSNVQSQKIAAALTELDIPPRLFMPTERVCKEFEKLIQSVNVLLDVRKYAEKVEAEIRVLEAAKEERERKERELLAPKTEEGTETAPIEEEKASAAIDNGNTEENAGERPQASTQATSDGTWTKGHKRSVSVLSAVSERSNKKQKK